MRLFLGCFLLSFLVHGPAVGQVEDEFDIPPPPPIIDDYEEPMIDPMMDEYPTDAEMVDGPIYEPPADFQDEPPQPEFDSANPPNNNGGRLGFSRGQPVVPRGGSAGGASGGGSFGQTEGKVKFEVVEGEYWEKGKKRSRGDRNK